MKNAVSLERARQGKICNGKPNMVRVITKGDKYDFVKSSLLSHYVASGYVVAVA